MHYAFPFFFAGFWAAILCAMSFFDGWMALARSYPVIGTPSGERFDWRSAKLGSMNYSGCLHLQVRPAGLYVSIGLPFRIGHPPFLVPWSDITAEPAAGFLWFRIVRLRFRRVPETMLDLSPGLARQLAAAPGSGLRLPPDLR